MWMLFLKLVDGEYEIVQAGYNLVPTKEYDKTLPTTERIARQFEKVYFDGNSLKVLESEALLSIEELNRELKVPENNEVNEIEIFDIE
ncbi:hypothetical protein BUY49_07040 [Staphylococcus devriesei]|uniref:hypothetical protein n=1 Tax=Staphylococcus devriesei TaxID=586733 RepID=UPI000E682A9F|nr:hypothetical protein [Staphylococcus devriesei]RIL71328.1 hypothetical protein BUY49_07040 [Staphylococcus devriesei]